MPFCKEFGIFLEGDDDKRFFEGVIEPLLSKKFPDFIFRKIRYAEKKKRVIKQFLKSFKDQECKCLFFKDYDRGPCYTEIIENLLNVFSSLKADEVFIARKSIESWYLAGASKDFLKKYDMEGPLEDTSGITERRFKGLFAGEPASLIKIEILESYDLEQAI